LFERKHPINSRESFVSGIAETPLLDLEKDFHSFFGRHGLPLVKVGFVGFLKALKDANDLLHITYLIRGRPVAFQNASPGGASAHQQGAYPNHSCGLHAEVYLS
jgi:hypothetical protein